MLQPLEDLVSVRRRPQLCREERLLQKVRHFGPPHLEQERVHVELYHDDDAPDARTAVEGRAELEGERFRRGPPLREAQAGRLEERELRVHRRPQDVVVEPVVARHRHGR